MRIQPNHEVDQPVSIESNIFEWLAIVAKSFRNCLERQQSISILKIESCFQDNDSISWVSLVSISPWAQESQEAGAAQAHHVRDPEAQVYTKRSLKNHIQKSKSQFMVRRMHESNFPVDPDPMAVSLSLVLRVGWMPRRLVNTEYYVFCAL